MNEDPWGIGAILGGLAVWAMIGYAIWVFAFGG